ncbi:MAG: biotin--[acetyl-CoA-carboxylase] ligase [Clostridia bacterium]|nr:biotin--[acetyl-CoA-carboxylase] ligase [Clostridia bacterium]
MDKKPPFFPHADILSYETISAYYPIPKHLVHVYTCLPSTNATAKAMAAAGAPEGTLCIAETQTAGRGRMGRDFFSPGKTGLYMSLVLHPDAQKDALSITVTAAVAVAEAAEALCGFPVQIKWVNDIYAKGKKVCGILAEASFSTGSKNLDFIVLGIGINLYKPTEGFPVPLQEIAGALFTENTAVTRAQLVGEILARFYRLYESPDKASLLEAYQSRSFLIGKTVTVWRGNTSFPATVLGINDDYTLSVLDTEGNRLSLSSGEVSLHNA